MSPPPHPSFLILPQAYMSDNNKRTRELILLKICFWTLSRISLQSSLVSNCISLHNILMKKMRSNKRNCMKYIKYKKLWTCGICQPTVLLYPWPTSTSFFFAIYLHFYTLVLNNQHILEQRGTSIYNLSAFHLHRYGTVLWILIKFILNVLIYSVVVSNCFI